MKIIKKYIMIYVMILRVRILHAREDIKMTFQNATEQEFAINIKVVGVGGGGVNAVNRMIASGVRGVGMAGAILDKESLATKNYAKITEKAKAVTSQIG